MKHLLDFLAKKNIRILLLAAGCSCFAMGAVQSSGAALTYFSENYTAQMSIYDIGVTLVEASAQGTKDISSRDYTGKDDVWKETQGVLVGDMLEETGGKLILGRNYKEELSVKNSGNIPEYVRVRIFKNWTKPDGSKETALDPDQIILGMTDNGWILDEKASTEERIVLYWPYILEVGESTPAFTSTLKIDQALASKVEKYVTTEGGKTTETYVFAYDGVRFNLEAEVDAVQTHNVVDAVKSAWGVDVALAADGSIHLK